MVEVGTEILRLVRNSPKHYSELKREIVTERQICSNQTLASHLKKLVKKGTISKKILPNRQTLYETRPEYERNISNALDLSKLKSLMENIQDRIIEDNIQLTEIKVKSGLDLYEKYIAGWAFAENAPKLRYAFYLDKTAMEKLKLFLKIED